MKKILVGLVLGIMGCMLVACASKNKETEASAPVVESIPVDNSTDIPEDESTVIDTSEDEIYVGMDWSTPWVDSDKQGVLDATGFDLVPPTDAVNIAYSYMPSTGMAQLNFNMENAMWIYRMQPTDALTDISDVYCEWDYTGETKVAGMDAMEYSYASEPEGDFIDDLDCTRVINWYDAQKKVTYSLVVMGKDLNGMDTAVYAENLFNAGGYVADATGVAEGDLYDSFLGLHVSSYDGSDIMVEEDYVHWMMA